MQIPLNLISPLKCCLATPLGGAQLYSAYAKGPGEPWTWELIQEGIHRYYLNIICCIQYSFGECKTCQLQWQRMHRRKGSSVISHSFTIDSFVLHCTSSVYTQSHWVRSCQCSFSALLVLPPSQGSLARQTPIKNTLKIIFFFTWKKCPENFAKTLVALIIPQVLRYNKINLKRTHSNRIF